MDKQERIEGVIETLVGMGVAGSEEEARAKAEEIVESAPELDDPIDQQLSDTEAALTQAADEAQAALEEQAAELQAKTDEAIRQAEERDDAE